MTPTKTSPAINVAGPSPSSVLAARGAILAILSAPNTDQKTKRVALVSLTSVLSMNVTIRGCTITHR